MEERKEKDTLMASRKSKLAISNQEGSLSVLISILMYLMSAEAISLSTNQSGS